MMRSVALLAAVVVLVSQVLHVSAASVTGCISPSGQLGPCAANTPRGVSKTVVLQGNNTSQGNNKALWRYRISALPPSSAGQLQTLDGVAITLGQVINGDAGTGFASVRFVPTTSFFSGVCDLNVAPNPDGSCPNGNAAIRLIDAKNRSLSATPSFRYALGYDFGSGNIVFDPNPATYVLNVLGVPGGNIAFTRPEVLTISALSNSYTDVSEASPNVAYSYSNLAGDTFRIILVIELQTNIRNVNITQLACLTYDEATVTTDMLVSFEGPGGANCKTKGTVKSYPSEMVKLLNNLRIFRPVSVVNVTTSSRQAVTIKYSIDDPGRNPADLSDPAPSVDIKVYEPSVVTWPGLVRPAADNSYIVIASVVLGLFFLFLYAILLIWWWVSLQPEPKALPEEVQEDAVAAANYDAKTDLDTLDHAGSPTAAAAAGDLRSSISLKNRRTIKRPLEESDRSLGGSPKNAKPIDEEPVDLTLADWEKHIDPRYNVPYFFNVKTGETSWWPPLPVYRAKMHASVLPSASVREDSK